MCGSGRRAGRARLPSSAGRPRSSPAPRALEAGAEVREDPGRAGPFQGSVAEPTGGSTMRSNGPSCPASVRSSRTSCFSFVSASGPGRSIGESPSQRAARRRGRRFGQRAATHTGIRGDCTGGGSNSPPQKTLSRSSPSSSRRALSRGSTTSPKGSSSSLLSLPRPTPRVRRPRLRRSSVTVSRASLWTRRRESGVTSGPRRIRSVAAATAASATQGSATARTGGR